MHLVLSRRSPRWRGLQLYGSMCVLFVAFALAWLPFEFAVALVSGSALLILALAHPIWAVGATILSVPVQELITLPAGLSVTQASLLLLGGSVALHIFAHPERRLVPGPIFWPLVIFLWALGLASVTTPFSQAEALRETLRWVTVLLIYLATMVALGMRHQNAGLGLEDSAYGKPVWQTWQLRVILSCLLLAPTLCAALGLYQFATGDGPPSFAIEGGRFVRAYGTIGQPNSFAGYMNMAWPLAAGLALSAGAELWQRWKSLESDQSKLLRPYGLLIALLASLLALAIIGGGLLASFSRGGWIGALGGITAITIAAIGLLPSAQRRRGWLLLGLGAVGAALIVMLASNGILPASLERRVASITGNLRLFDVRDVSVNPENFAVVERMAHLQAAGNMVARHPLTGVGPGNFTTAYEFGGTATEPPYFLHPWYTSRGHAHNYYVHIAAEDGLIGLAAFLVLLAATARQAWRALATAQGWLWRGVALGGASVVAAVATHDLFENLHALHLGLQLGAVWALLVLVERCSGTRTM